MKAIVCRSYGLPENLKIEELPNPQPTEDQVLVDVVAAGVNFPDVLMVAGKYQSQPPFPFAPGSEAAGRVRAVGSKIHDLKPGDTVIAQTGHGSFAEQVVARRGSVRIVPKGMDLIAASGLAVTYGTSFHALKQRANLQPGETLLVTGAAGGVGIAAVELGKAMGATVIAAASSDDKLAVARAAGADHLINYSNGNLRDPLKEITNGKGVDVAYDPVGGPMFEQIVRSAAWNGRVLIVGFVGGDIPKVATNLLLLKGAAAVGVFYGSFSARNPRLDQENFDTLFRWFAEGKIKPKIHRVYAMHEYAEALNALANRQVMGKAIIQIGS